MGASTGNMLVDDHDTLDRIFSDASLLVATHCEDTPTIRANEERFRQRYGEDVPMSAHPEIRSAEACFKSSSFAVELAQRHHTRLHILHLTTARELELFDRGPIESKHITAEVCVHHLWFDDSDYADQGARIKCNPAIKTAAQMVFGICGMWASDAYVLQPRQPARECPTFTLGERNCKDLQRSIRRAHPLGGIPIKHRGRFLRSLTARRRSPWPF